MASVAAGSRTPLSSSEPSVVAAAARLPLEHRMLLTATLCLLAGGAVMVYSASAPATLSGGGSGTSSLIHFTGYALAGLVVLQVAARVGLDSIRRLTGPLLALAFCLLVAVRVPGIGHSNGSFAQRWVGFGA